MTRIVLERQNGKIIFFEVKGHSGHGTAGHDIVCASVSSVVWMVINGLENILGLDITYKQEVGFVNCRLPSLPNSDREKADVLLESMARFFDSLEKQYGEFISKTEV